MRSLHGIASPLLLASMLLACMLLALSGCGYSFNHQGSDALPKEMRTLYIAAVENPTTETWLGPHVRSQLRDELTRRGWTRWGDRSNADGMVTVTIKQFTRSSSVQDESDNTSKYDSAVNLSATIKDRATGHTVWQSGEVGWNGSYYGDTERARDDADAYAVDNAIRRLADLLSEGY